jgi:protein SERAC1
MKNSNSLFKISGCDNPESKVDVIFVHGLNGSAKATWHPENKQDDNNCWPYWLGKEYPDFGIWSFGYASDPSEWRGKTMPLFDRASNLLDWLDTREIGKRPVVFITHSMGGLVVKKMLNTAQNFNKYELIEQTKGIVFLSTPHTGSHLANLIDNIKLLTRTTISVQELRAHAPELRELNEWYRQNFRAMGIDTKVYYETQPVHGVLVVDPDSANPGIEGVKPIALEENHISICRPFSEESQVYLSVKKFIERECLQSPQPLQIDSKAISSIEKDTKTEKIVVDNRNIGNSLENNARNYGSMAGNNIIN